MGIRFEFCAVWLLLAGALGQASMIIDDFSVEQIPPSVSANGGFSDTTISDPSPTILGGTRRMTVQTFSGVGSVSQTSESGAYRLSKPPGTYSTSSLHWEGPGGSGLGGIDLTEGGFIDRFRIRGSSDGPMLIEILAWSSGASEISRRQINVNAGPFVIDLVFGDFVPDADPVNFTDITRIVAGVHGNAENVVISDIVTAPAPMTAAIFGLGTAGVLRRRR